MRFNSKEIAKEFDFAHLSILNCLNKYRKQFNKLDDTKVLEKVIEKREKGSKGGRPAAYYLLNEKQKEFLLLLLNNKKTSLYKFELVKKK